MTGHLKYSMTVLDYLLWKTFHQLGNDSKQWNLGKCDA